MGQMTRDEMRSALLGSHKPKSQLITLFGVEVELRQPTLGAIMRARETEDPVQRAADMIVRYSYVPGTNEQVFEASDMDVISGWPFGEDFIALQKAITDLTGVNIDDAEKDLRKDPLESESSDSASS